MPDTGYVNYYRVLGLDDGANPGEVRKTYKRLIKKLVQDIAQQQITEAKRDEFLLEMAKLNAAVYLLRDKNRREAYWSLREELIALEAEWSAAQGSDGAQDDAYRRAFDSKLRDFLTVYVEEAMLEAGRDPECVEGSHWDAAHERHSFRMLREYRHGLHQDILERLPYYEVTPPKIDWDARRALARSVATGAAHGA